MTRDAGGADGIVSLAHVVPFRLGEVDVYPATRQLVRGARSETIEPRVMQVLVALAQAQGKVLTRDELIARCWGGRIVVDNAINRVISRIRHLAVNFGMESFHLETITKVGYRIVIGDRTDEPALFQHSVARPTMLSRRRLAIGGAGAIAAVLAGAAFFRGAAPNARSQAALALYRKGLEARGQALPEQGLQAVAYFREAARIDPNFADAWGALALGYRSLLEYGSRGDSAQVAALSRSAAARALELDPANVDAKVAVALLDPFYRNWARIEGDCRTLLGHHPDHAVIRYNLGWVLNDVGRSRDSIAVLERLNAQEPFWPLARHGYILALWHAGRLDESSATMEDAVRRWPGHSLIWQTRMSLLMTTGQAGAALSLGADLAQRPINYPRDQLAMRMHTAQALVSQAPADIRAATATVIAETRRNPTLILFSTQLLAVLGQVDEAFAMTEGYFFERGRWASAAPAPSNRWTRRYTGFLFNPMTASMRGDSRFAMLMREIGLEQYWSETRSSPDMRLA